MATARDGALVGGPFVEHAVQNAGAAGVGEEFAVVTDQAARGDIGDDAGLARARRFHLGQLALARAGKFLDHRAGVFIIHVDGNFLDRLVTLSINLAKQHLGAGDRQLEPLAAHVLDQDAHLQFAATGNLEGLTARGVGNLDGDVGFRFFHQALADHARLHLLAVTARQRRVVDAEGHGDGGRVDGLGFQWVFHGKRADGVGHGGLGHAGKRDDIAGKRLVDILLCEAPESLDTGNAELLDLLAKTREGLHRLADLETAAFDATGQEAAHEGVGTQCRGQHPEVIILMLDLLRRGDMVDDQVEQRVQ
mmetsp:Transcript_6478/g.11126  ORF Transcript_6478/g.11126 Transcript_6478/m.11126 type:complete len:307 (+) Transcript_6478:9-929(+)